MSKLILPDTVAVGIFNTALSVKEREETRNRVTTMFELELPMEKGGVSFIDQENAPIEKDLLICAKPGQVRHTRLPYKCYYIHIIVPNGTLYKMLSSLPPFLLTEQRNLYQELFKKIIRAYETHFEADELIMQAALLELIHLWHTEARTHGTAGSAKSRAVEEAITYIKDHLAEELTLESVAKAVSLSPIHFHNTFRTATGKTLRRYVEEQRLHRAIGLLTESEKTLTEIALECGFSSQSYFSYAFKRKMGETPRAYAKALLRRYYA